MNELTQSMQLSKRAENLLSIVDDYVDCRSINCRTCPLHCPGVRLQIVDDPLDSSCGYALINRVIRTVLDKAPEEV